MEYLLCSRHKAGIFTYIMLKTIKWGRYYYPSEKEKNGVSEGLGDGHGPEINHQTWGISHPLALTFSPLLQTISENVWCKGASKGPGFMQRFRETEGEHVVNRGKLVTPLNSVQHLCLAGMPELRCSNHEQVQRSTRVLLSSRESLCRKMVHRMEVWLSGRPWISAGHTCVSQRQHLPAPWWSVCTRYCCCLRSWKQAV